MNVIFQWTYILFFFAFIRTTKNCSFPVTWDGIWNDSTEGTLTISRGTNQINPGWTITLGASSVSTWTCLAEDVSNNLFVFRGDSSLSFFSSTIIPYICIQWTNVTDYSFYYYILADIQSNGINERVYLEQYNPAITTWSTSTYCSPTNPPGAEEFHMAVKQGSESTAKIEFPSEVIGTISYTYSSSGSLYCASASHLDICTDKTTATFNYTVCSIKQLFSSEGILYCVASITSGLNTYVSVLNPGTVDNINYFRFSCLAMQASGSSISCSLSARSCEQSQSPTVATSTGGILTLSVTDNCTTLTTTSGTTTVSSTTSASNNITYINVTSNANSFTDRFCSDLEKSKCYGILASVCTTGAVLFAMTAFVSCMYLCQKRQRNKRLDRLPTQLTVREMKEPCHCLDPPASINHENKETNH